MPLQGICQGYNNSAGNNQNSDRPGHRALPGKSGYNHGHRSWTGIPLKSRFWKTPAMAGKLKEPRVITDHQREPVCILPTGFYFDDVRWEKIWRRHEEKGAALTHQDLLELFPEEPVLLNRKVAPQEPD